MRKKTRFFLFLLLAGILCLALGVKRFGLNPDKEKIDILAAAQNILSFEPARVRELRAQKVKMEEEGHFEYYFKQLDKEEQRAYREMLASFRKWEDEFYLTISGNEKVDKVYHAVLNDHPELFWVRNRNPVYKTQYSGQNYCTFSPGYEYGGKDNKKKLKSKQAKAILAAMEEAIADIDELAPPEVSEYEKVAAVYEYLIDEVEYVLSKHDQNLAGVFWKKKAVCAGYAAAMQYLLEHLGVFCIYVEGDAANASEGHAWNIVRIDGEYYYVDVTNGDQPEFLFGDIASMPWHKTIMIDYLCPFPEEYEETYTPSDLFEVPECTETDYNFYVLNNGCFDYYDPDEMNSYFHMRTNFGSAVIRWKFTTEEAFQEALDHWSKSPQMEEAIQYYMSVNNLMQIEYHIGTLDSFKTIYYIF